MGVSTDGGATWTPLCARTGDYAISLGLDPISGLPAYLGGGASGAWRSRDGGQTCELATDGITGLPIQDLATSPIHPETIYVAAEHAGGFMSSDTGHSWRQLALSFPFVDAVTVDPQQPNTAYFAGGHMIHHNPEDGTVWMVGVVTDTRVKALAVVPISHSILYAGGCSDAAFFLNQDVGRIFRSLDYGKTWTQLDVGQPISRVVDIAIHPTNSQTVYLAVSCQFCSDGTLESPGLGVFRSSDGGETWQPTTQGMGQVPVSSLAIHPNEPQMIYAGAVLTSNGKATVFKSTNNGDHWTTTSLQLDWGSVVALVIDPLSPDTVYAGTDVGLFRTTDGGATWTRAAGNLGYVRIQGLAAASANQRTILYVGTLGGFPSGVSASGFSAAALADGDFVQGGVYQQTIVHPPLTEKIYLPLVVRDD